jgi:phenylpropionate dioxygenase-like ring-hydroxylating dioxygenase large terminal subunit
MIALPIQDRLQDLVQPTRVHQDVYTDPEIFELEMDRIFGRAWVYVGHDSQVPNRGDYWTTIIGRAPVVMVRDKNGEVHVLHNRCPHKGAKIIPDGCGNAGPILRCPYHAWTFKLDGSLVGVPYRGGYDGTGFDPQSADFSMRKVARVDSYHGFVFASLCEGGPDLKTFLGGAATTLDNLVDRAPTGRIEIAGGMQRVLQENNWKLFLENMNDTAHAPPTHESSYAAARQTARNRFEGEKPFFLQVMEANAAPSEFWESLRFDVFDYGHSYLDTIFSPPDDEVTREHREQLIALHGAERANEILSVNRHNTTIYPSCSPHLGFQQLRVIRPLSVDRTMIEFFTFRLVGTSEQLFQRAIGYMNLVNSPSSVIAVDDIDLYRRCQEGMASNGGKWVSHHRSAGTDIAVEGGSYGGGTSELPMRNQFRAWQEYMAQPTAAKVN